MNLAAYFAGCVKVLRGDSDWAASFDLSRAGLKQSFLALLLSVPAYYVAALAIATQRAKLSENGADTALISWPVFSIIVLLYSLSFSASAYLITMVFDRQDRFRPWVIVRHWTTFYMVLIVATAFGATLLGVLPFMVANGIAFALYLSTLAVDIRLASKIVGFEWAGAVYTACLIAAMGLCMVLMGVSQVSATAGL